MNKCLIKYFLHRQLILLICFAGCGLQLSAQNKYNNNWYFGNRAVIDFSSNPPTAGSGSVMNTYRSASAVSDPDNGQLLFYTNGNSFWNRFGEMVDSSVRGDAVGDVCIIPLRKYKNRFMVFNFNQFFILDMTARNGRGSILKKENFVLNSGINRMTAVRHCLSESYWLICINGKSFFSYLVHPDGSIDAPVESLVSDLETSPMSGDLVSSNSGELLAMTSYAPLGSKIVQTQVFNFNKRCGTVENKRTLLPMNSNWNYPHGVCFSPNDRFIYVAYGYMESQLVQYETDDVQKYVVVAESDQNFNQIACGPDKRLYITTHISGIPSNKIDVLLSPDLKGSACQYRENYMRLAGVTNFEVPNLIVCHNASCTENSGFSLPRDTALCTNQDADYSLQGSRSGIDSMVWYFGDPQNPLKGLKGFQVNHQYTQSGDYTPYIVIYACGNCDTFRFKIKVNDRVDLFIGRDTTLCAGDSISIGDDRFGGPYLWSDGANTSHITVSKPGKYQLSINHPGCVSRDTIVISFHPTLKTLLGDHYYICEEEKELVILDAGKGFNTYLWHPTSDSTQWIEVDKRGQYYVVVSDFRGCKGKGESEVLAICDLRVFLPNAFSPNADGLNDSLRISGDYIFGSKVEIFNIWGECIYNADVHLPWDGKYKGEPVPQGVYLLRLSVEGFINKKSVIRHYSTTLQVIY